MNWANFYLGCFLVGFLLTFVTLLLGRMNLHVHMPHGHLGGIHFGQGGAHVGGAHGGVHATAHGQGGSAGARGGGHAAEAEISPFNFATFTVFLAWFGGAGYILTRYYDVVHVTALILAALSGLVGAYIVFRFLARLAAAEHDLDPVDYQMPGVLGRVVSPIREGGTGEIVYVQGGTRHTCGARAEDGSAIPRQEEIVVTRYEKGIAYVRRWEELEKEVANSE